MISRTHTSDIGQVAGCTASRIQISVVGLALSSFLALSFVLCVLGSVVLPNLPITHSALSIFLPGFTLLDWKTFCLGLAESFLWGWYIAAGFGLLYNAFASMLTTDE